MFDLGRRTGKTQVLEICVRKYSVRLEFYLPPLAPFIIVISAFQVQTILVSFQHDGFGLMF